MSASSSKSYRSSESWDHFKCKSQRMMDTSIPEHSSHTDDTTVSGSSHRRSRSSRSLLGSLSSRNLLSSSSKHNATSSTKRPRHQQSPVGTVFLRQASSNRFLKQLSFRSSTAPSLQLDVHTSRHEKLERQRHSAGGVRMGRIDSNGKFRPATKTTSRYDA